MIYSVHCIAVLAAAVFAVFAVGGQLRRLRLMIWTMAIRLLHRLLEDTNGDAAK